jgi:D-sedoheptulose 7-phosphate isomerase
MPGKNGHGGGNGNGNGGSTAHYFERLSSLIPRLPYADVDRIAALIVQAFHNSRTVFVFGNGGSAASASHMMCDMNKGTIDPGQSRRLKVLALTDNVPLMTAWANDSHYEQIFAEQLRNFAQKGDIAFAISGSGNSPNVLMGLEAAREIGAQTAGITGYEGGKMKALCDVCAVVPCENMQLIEDMHHAILHSMFAAVAQQIRLAAPTMLTTGADMTEK